MKKLVVGILAHVDAGKTTLSESMLYVSGKTQRLGRVDKKDAYLDTHTLEKERGITIFSKQALLDVGDAEITLLDTPGHVDFSAEMERTLQVLDYAVLVVSGADGVQGHTATLWQLLSAYQIPVFIFVNKMDQPGTQQKELLAELQLQLKANIVDFTRSDHHFYEELSFCDEALMDSYLAQDTIEDGQIRAAIAQRQVFPCYFGSALKLEGVIEFLQGLGRFTAMPAYPENFGARVFKISRDEQGSRLAHLKITGGRLRVRDLVKSVAWEEKVNQIRIYSGENFTSVDEVGPGSICAVTGLTQARAGEGVGFERRSRPPILEPVLAYTISLPNGVDPPAVLPLLWQLEEEKPELRIVWDERLQEIQAQVMGDVQVEVLQSLIAERFGLEVSFDAGQILYKESIVNSVEGVGHFEPLRHYAEVHLLLEPAERGSGLHFALDCSEDVLARNWQRQVLTHLEEKAHKGVLTGSEITDIQITLVAGRAHNTHTQGGDFREATYRARRQGLKEAESILLEPWYQFTLELPEKMVGRAITDIERMFGIWEIAKSDREMTVLCGSAPVVTMRNYHKEVASFTKGLGRLSLRLAGYQKCHNAEEVVERIGYDSERDVENPTGSIFCSRGTGFFVPWHEVKGHMHVAAYLAEDIPEIDLDSPLPQTPGDFDFAEGDYPFLQTTKNQGKRIGWNRRQLAPEERYEPPKPIVPPKTKETYLLVDGYNVIHAWPELKELAESHLDAARARLLDALSSYQGVKNWQVIVVFDAYAVSGRREELERYHNIYVVFTKEAQTADQYIEKFAYDHRKEYDIVVATSDALQQVIIRGAGSQLLSARELKEEIEIVYEQAKQSYQGRQRLRRTNLEEVLSSDVKKQMDDLT